MIITFDKVFDEMLPKFAVISAKQQNNANQCYTTINEPLCDTVYTYIMKM